MTLFFEKKAFALFFFMTQMHESARARERERESERERERESQ